MSFCCGFSTTILIPIIVAGFILILGVVVRHIKIWRDKRSNYGVGPFKYMTKEEEEKITKFVEEHKDEIDKQINKR